MKAILASTVVVCQSASISASPGWPIDSERSGAASTMVKAREAGMDDMPKVKTPEERTFHRYKTPDDFLSGPRGPPRAYSGSCSG